ncbi:MAG: L-seryl-tRNA(Sec) selenium transferase, partial [Planctomycetota bacterium]|nr:L-seryl-tRNA(Sec) selenium transferase [Planctomycetota bacterium]
MSKQSRTGRARIPSMTSLLEAAAARRQLGKIPQSVLTDALRQAVDAVRRAMENGESADRCNAQALLDDAEKLIAARNAARLRRVINATGIVLHTGLGRSVLADAARERLAGAAAGYSNLEIDLDSGQRGRRGAYAERLLCELTGATAAMIVNNNAAATMLALRGLAHGREVIVSRGHLIEIGGSFRLPEVMTAGGVVLREVGTTNKTRVSDFEAAVCERTALIMHVHTSNYRVVGFAETPTVGALVALAHDRGLPLLDDLGSGALLDDPLWTAASEPSVLASLAQGADLLTFSADKLLGGPQAGILLGTAEIIDRLRRDPMARALRVDKLTLGALEATLELYQ